MDEKIISVCPICFHQDEKTLSLLCHEDEKERTTRDAIGFCKKHGWICKCHSRLIDTGRQKLMSPAIHIYQCKKCKNLASVQKAH